MTGWNKIFLWDPDMYINSYVIVKFGSFSKLYNMNIDIFFVYDYCP